jgi:3-dehydroquinate dehydratase / shikimate dehydrogenase
MNNGKICISVCASTVDELREKIECAATLCDLIELRLDCLNPPSTAISQIDIEPNMILTLRPREQGGNGDLDLKRRQEFWSSINVVCGADLEEDVIGSVPRDVTPRICSFHDFDYNGGELETTYSRLAATDADVLKIAVSANDITDTIETWKLLERAKKDGRNLISIAMGEAGKWTRILGLAHGAYLTYAALDSGGETAPGQITAREMIDVFRVKELDESTEVYGIIAGDTTYTMSPYIHNAAFKAAGLNAVFVPLQVKDPDTFMRRMVLPKTREVDLNFRGFSVTNPLKQPVIQHLDQVDDAAAKIGAVNTIKIEGGKLLGFNTDAQGFIKPLAEKFGDLKNTRAVVVGAGGAARACIYSLKNAGANVTIFVRNIQMAGTLADEFGVDVRPLSSDLSNFDIVVNATPLGTRGKGENETIATAQQLRGVKLVYDLVYNPTETRLLREAKLAGAQTLGGFEMLMAQAAEQFKIWTGKPAPIEEMTEAARRKLDES